MLLPLEVFIRAKEAFTSFGQVRKDEFGSFCLARARLSCDDNRLVYAVSEQVLE